MFILFGLVAGGDMTRIIFLGFPFIMTLILMEMKNFKLLTLWPTVVLSIPALWLYPFHANVNWAVDYAEPSYVWGWAIYFSVAYLILIVVTVLQKRIQAI